MTKLADTEASGGSQTLERGIRLLNLLTENPEGLTVSAIAAKLGTHRPGVYRLLRPLQTADIVERRVDGTYVLGVGLVVLASHVRSRLQEIATVELQQLANEVQATAALTIRSGNDALVLAVQQPFQSQAHIAYRAGLRHALSQAASGLAILAGEAPLPSEREEVTLARIDGYTYTQSELFAGASGVGVPVFGHDGSCVAALSVVWLGEVPNPANVAKQLRARADTITLALGLDSGTGLAQSMRAPANQ